MTVLLGLAAALVLIVLILMFRVQGLLSIVRGSDKNPGGTMNKLNATLFVIFGVVTTVLFIWYSITRFDTYTLPIASEHGLNTDNLFWVTTILISIVVIVVNALLFGFAFKYQYKETNKAKFFPDHHLLELTWTVIPALVLTYLVFNGWKEWKNITETPAPQLLEEKVELEVVGQQFYWNVRYPGSDKELGEHYFRNIDDDNVFGLKVTDEEAWDDFMPRKIVIPKGRKIHLIIRAKDVLHSVYLPHFRVKMDALPGMPTEFWFTATKTTQEMRNEQNNQEFTYELACAEMCGKGHYSMRYEVEVLENDDYEKWLAESCKSSWALENAEYVLATLKKQGAPESITTKFLNFVASKDLDKSKSLSTEEVSNNDTLEVKNDSVSVSDTLSVLDDSLNISVIEDNVVEDTVESEDESKNKNIIHKAGDVVENHREKKAERKGEDYEEKENGLHKLGDKVE